MPLRLSLKDPMSHIFWMAKEGGPFPFNTIENRKRFYKLKYCICNRYIEKIRHFQFPLLLDLSGGGVEGVYPLLPSPSLWCLLTPPPSFHCFLTGLFENNQKYIADHSSYENHTVPNALFFKIHFLTLSNSYHNVLSPVQSPYRNTM